MMHSIIHDLDLILIIILYRWISNIRMQFFSTTVNTSFLIIKLGTIVQPLIDEDIGYKSKKALMEAEKLVNEIEDANAKTKKTQRIWNYFYATVVIARLIMYFT